MEEYSSAKEDRIICPECNANIKPLKFCTQCGISMTETEKVTNKSISEKLSEKRDQSSSSPMEDETIKSIKSSGEGLMKGLGGLMNKSKKRDKTMNPGYLVCDSCEGYYQLAKDEKPEDFTDECECGGRYKHQMKL